MGRSGIAVPLVRLPLPDGDAVLHEGFFTSAESDAFFEALEQEIPWKQETIKLYGKELALPRLTSWHGEPGAYYTYSGLTLAPLPWSPILLAIKARVEVPCKVKFTSALLNLYRSGSDGVAWHSDDEPQLGPAPVIASVSLGGARHFQLKHKRRAELEKVEVELTHGSLLIMRGDTQKLWHHQVPKTKKPVRPRINLTFRVV